MRLNSAVVSVGSLGSQWLSSYLGVNFDPEMAEFLRRFSGARASTDESDPRRSRFFSVLRERISTALSENGGPVEIVLREDHYEVPFDFVVEKQPQGRAVLCFAE